MAMATLAEQLGYPADAKLVLLHADGLGLCHATNVGVYDSLRRGLATTASLMVPCPWARGAVADYRGEDVGVHLTLNADHDHYRWGPITHAPSLLDGDGGFPRTVTDLWDHADPDEVRRECRAQIERAILWGFDVSHIVPHLGALQDRPELFDIYVELAVDFGLPMRLSDPAVEATVGFPFRQLAAEEGVVFPDHLLASHPVGGRRRLAAALAELQPGVTEVPLHPAVDSPELRAAAPDWASRVDDHDLLVDRTSLLATLERAGAHLIGYRRLRTLMRNRRPTARVVS